MSIGSLRRGIKQALLQLPTVQKRRARYLNEIRADYDTSQAPPSILCTTCIGGMISHNLGLRFMSPTINMWMLPKDFVRFAARLDEYLALELQFVDTKYEYPVARLGDVTIYFQHYHTNREAADKWNERKLRIDRENLYLITDDAGLSPADVEALRAIPCKRLIIFTKDDQPGDCYFLLECYRHAKKLGLYSVRDFHGFAPFEREFNYAAWLSGSDALRFYLT